MPGAIAFGAKTTRENNYVGVIKGDASSDFNHLGPGYYELGSTLSKHKPSYAAFGSATDRKFGDNGNDASRLVGPQDSFGGGGGRNGGSFGGGPESMVGSFEMPASDYAAEQEQEQLRARALSRARGKREGSLYRGGSNARRFTGQAGEAANAKSLAAAAHKTPGPGAYAPPDYWAKMTVDRVALRQMEKDLANNAPVQWMRVPTAPSIPGREQSYGYEEGQNGELVQQEPVDKGYTGKGNDIPGPAQYMPKPVQKHSHVVDFGRASGRELRLPHADPTVVRGSSSIPSMNDKDHGQGFRKATDLRADDSQNWQQMLQQAQRVPNQKPPGPPQSRWRDTNADLYGGRGYEEDTGPARVPTNAFPSSTSSAAAAAAAAAANANASFPSAPPSASSPRDAAADAIDAAIAGGDAPPAVVGETSSIASNSQTSRTTTIQIPNYQLPTDAQSPGQASQGFLEGTLSPNSQHTSATGQFGGDAKHQQQQMTSPQSMGSGGGGFAVPPEGSRSPLPVGSAHLYNPHQHPRAQTPNVSPQQQAAMGIPQRSQTQLGRGVSSGSLGNNNNNNNNNSGGFGGGFGDGNNSLYDQYGDVPMSPPMSPPKPSSMFRSAESVPRRTPVSHAETPGPGAYAAYSSLNIDRRKRPPHLQFFGSTGERFQQGPRTVAHLGAIPGPGAYKAVSSDFDRTKKNKWNPARPPDEMVGFRSTTVRFGNPGAGKDPTANIGPGQYEIPGMATVTKKKIAKSKQDGPFGSSSKRFQRFSSFDTPGPGQYTKMQPPGAVGAGSTSGLRVQHGTGRGGGGGAGSGSGSGSGSEAAAAAAMSAARSSSMSNLRRGVKGPAPAGSGMMRGTYVTRPNSASLQQQRNRPSAAFAGPPRDPTDYDRRDPNLIAAAAVKQQPRRDPAVVRRKRTEAGGGGVGHGIAAEDRRAADAKRAAAAAAAAASGATYGGTSATARAAQRPSPVAVGPTPSTYDVSQQRSLHTGGSWTTKAGPDISRGGERFPEPKHETGAGPGSYHLPSAIAGPDKYRTVRGVMDSKEPRDRYQRPTTNVPGPGAYDVALNYGNLLRPTFNVAIAEAAADIRY